MGKIVFGHIPRTKEKKMKGNFVYTIIKSMLILALLITLIGITNAQAQPTNIVGSWKCGVDGAAVFLVTFNLDGTLTATDGDTATSDYHGTWKRTGLNSFESTDYSFYIPGQCIVETYTINTMTDNNTIKANAVIKDCDGNMTTGLPELTCTRIPINPM